MLLSGTAWRGLARWHAKKIHIATTHRNAPPAVKDIDDGAFRGCTNRTNLEFYGEIEAVVPCEAMRGWWNGGVQEGAPRHILPLGKIRHTETFGSRSSMELADQNIFDDSHPLHRRHDKVSFGYDRFQAYPL